MTKNKTEGLAVAGDRLLRLPGGTVKPGSFGGVGQLAWLVALFINWGT